MSDDIEPGARPEPDKPADRHDLLRVIRIICVVLALVSGLYLVASLGYVNLPGVKFASSGTATATPVPAKSAASTRVRRATPTRKPVPPAAKTTTVPPISPTAKPHPTNTPVQHVAPAAVTNYPLTALVGRTETFSLNMKSLSGISLTYQILYPNGHKLQATVRSDKNGKSSHTFVLVGYVPQTYRLQYVQIRALDPHGKVVAARFFALQK